MIAMRGDQPSRFNLLSQRYGQGRARFRGNPKLLEADVQFCLWSPVLLTNPAAIAIASYNHKVWYVVVLTLEAHS
jgi:hypothetical protein